MLQQSLPGGIRCEKCKRVNTFELYKTEVKWIPVLRVFDFTKCSNCGHRNMFSYEPDRELKFDIQTDSYKSVKRDEQ